MKAVVIGPGRIGCGLAGQVLAAAGAAVTFVGRGAALDQLARARRYRVRLTDGARAEEHEVPVAAALSVHDPAVAAAIADARLVVVSVGRANLPAVAPLLAVGLARRKDPVNVLAFENAPDAGARLRFLVVNRLPADAPEHGFSSAVVSRIVARRVGLGGRDPLVFVGDPPADVAIHAPALRAPLPAIPALRAVEDLDAWFARKLFVFSAGHAVAAYLGALKGYRYIHSAIRDPEIRPTALALAAAAALCFRCPDDPSACELQAALGTGGVQRTLRDVSGLEPDEDLGRTILESFRNLARGRESDNLLLNLERRQWSWRAASRPDSITA